MKALFPHWQGPFLSLGYRPLTLPWIKSHLSSPDDITHSVFLQTHL